MYPQYWIAAVMDFVLNAGSAACDAGAHNEHYSWRSSFNAEPGPRLVVYHNSGIRDARMAYRLLNASRPRASFTLVAVGYKDPGDQDIMALLQHEESSGARQASAMKCSFTTRQKNLTSYEDKAEKNEHVLAPDSEDGQDPGEIQPASVASRWRGKERDQRVRPDCEGMLLCS
jgi:hypothetical protein